MYADGAMLIVTGKSLLVIQTTIMSEQKTMSSWFFENRLTLNAAKTKYIIFHSRYKTSNNLITLTLGSSLIQPVSSFKYLGVIFDCHLCWKEQINNACKKLAFECHTFIKARYYFPYDVRITLSMLLFLSFTYQLLL